MIRFDTPGGGLAETVAIAEVFNNARGVPILGWVGPVGGHAWSAGTILLVPTDLAAMAPGTTIGSVQPVEVGPGGIVPVTDPKIINAVVTAIYEELALHTRSTALAARFVIDNLTLNATQAQSLRATELVAASPQEFATLADGRRVVVQRNATVYKAFTLHTAGAEIVTFSSSARVRLLEILSDPLVASLMLILGIYLVIFGISAPGHGAEIAGIIILLLALIGLGFSVDPIALLLFIVGVILIIIEIKTPGFGVFGIGGIIAIVFAAALLPPFRPPRVVRAAGASIQSSASPLRVPPPSESRVTFQTLKARRRFAPPNGYGRQSVQDRRRPGRREEALRDHGVRHPRGAIG